MKLNDPEEILLCHGNEKATNHFSPLISTVALGDIFGSQVRALQCTQGGKIGTITVGG